MSEEFACLDGGAVSVRENFPKIHRGIVAPRDAAVSARSSQHWVLREAMPGEAHGTAFSWRLPQSLERVKGARFERGRRGGLSDQIKLAKMMLRRGEEENPPAERADAWSPRRIEKDWEEFV